MRSWESDVMLVEEIFAKIKNHMLEGMVFHDQMARYYDFLNLGGYKRCHEYHYFEETLGYRKLCRYFMNHYHMFIPYDDMDNPQVIPDSWYKYTRQEVDSGTKRSSVKTGIEKWVDWEKKTKKLYQDMYKELMEMGEVAAAEKIMCYVKDVDCELKCAERKHINLESIGYDLSTIVYEQEEFHEKYRKKLEKLCTEL